MFKKTTKTLGTLLTVALLMVMGIVVAKPVVANAAEYDEQGTQTEVTSLVKPTFGFGNITMSGFADKNSTGMEVIIYDCKGKKIKSGKIAISLEDAEWIDDNNSFEAVTDTTMYYTLDDNSSWNGKEWACGDYWCNYFSYGDTKAGAKRTKKYKDMVLHAKARSYCVNSSGTTIYSPWSDYDYYIPRDECDNAESYGLKGSFTKKEIKGSFKPLKGVKEYQLYLYDYDKAKFICIKKIKATKTNGTVNFKIKRASLSKKNKKVYDSNYKSIKRAYSDKTRYIQDLEIKVIPKKF